jgi:hypothetical protein
MYQLSPLFLLQFLFTNCIHEYEEMDTNKFKEISWVHAELKIEFNVPYEHVDELWNEEAELKF